MTAIVFDRLFGGDRPRLLIAMREKLISFLLAI